MLKRLSAVLLLSMGFFVVKSQVNLNFDKPDIEFQRALNAYEKGLYNKAIRGFERYISTSTSKDYVHESQYYIVSSKLRLAQTNSYEYATKFLEEYPISQRAMFVKKELGDYFYYQKDYKKAARYYKMVLNILHLHPGLVWGFGITVMIMLLLDLGVFNKKSHVVTSKEATIWTLVWISLAMAFSGIVYYVFNKDTGGHELAIEKFTQFQAAYWIEKALSVDNLFVFILVFSYFKVPRELHHKVLFWGVLGALVFRAVFIFAGVGIINVTYVNPILEYFNIKPLNWDINIVLTLFGLFLIYAGIKSWGSNDDDDEQDFSNSAGAKLVRKLYRVHDNYDKDKFFTIQNGAKIATPLLVVVAVIEFTDVLFAVDSIPAIFAISKDPFILYTSNIFAILGLRSLYFLLSNFIHMFSKLPYGLSIILAFIGIKMVISPWYHIPSPISLAIVVGVLILSVLISIAFPEKKDNV